MTKEERINYIETWLTDEYSLNSKDREALTAGLNALKNWPYNSIEKSAIIRIIEHNKGLQTQINLVLSRIIKEIQDYPFIDGNELHG